MVQSNLRALFQIDSWAVGVLVAMISGSLNVPFAADADWRRGYLTPKPPPALASSKSVRTSPISC